MRQYDLSPLYRSTVGFDRLFTILDQMSGVDASAQTYPPYNIERTGENAYRISVAVAGFSEDAAGLGILVLTSYRQLRTDLLFAAVLVASVLGLALFGVVNLTGWRLLRRWHPSASGG